MSPASELFNAIADALRAASTAAQEKAKDIPYRALWSNTKKEKAWSYIDGLNDARSLIVDAYQRFCDAERRREEDEKRLRQIIREETRP